LQKNASAIQVEITDFQTGLSFKTNNSEWHKQLAMRCRQQSAAVDPKVSANLCSADFSQSLFPGMKTLKRAKGLDWTGVANSKCSTNCHELDQG
jgi:hypothetical protein